MNAGGAKPRDICERAFAYALRAVRLYQHLQVKKDRAGWIMGEQFMRAATPIGANLEEAQAGESRNDFVHKCGIARKEARECLYWLRLITEAKVMNGSDLALLLKETDELVAILTAIVHRAKMVPKQ